MVLRVPGNCVCQRGLARAVGAHDRVDRTLLEVQVDTLEDVLGSLIGLDADVQVDDFES